VRTPPRDYSTLSLPSFLSLIRLFFGSLYLFIEKEEKRSHISLQVQNFKPKSKDPFYRFLGLEPNVM
jgi:hypothetical protein